MAAPVEPGTILGQKYRVERVLSAGGMGVVVSATHVELRRLVCLKFMLGDLSQQVEAVERFLHEARAAIQLKGPHVCRVMDVGRLDSGAPFIVMELLEGTDLADLVRERGALAPADAVRYLVQACQGLSEAHALGIIHRDIKPANLFVTRLHGGEIVKVLDFGISKSQLAGDGFATSTHAVLGTPAYMSPEQMRSSKNVDVRTDVWALGAVLYHLLSGRPPFVADNITEIITQVLNDEPPALVAPPDLVEIVRRCLHKERERRFASVDELSSALQRARTDQLVAGRALEPAQQIAPTVPPSAIAVDARQVAPTVVSSAASSQPPVAPTTRRRRWPWIVVSVSVLASIPLVLGLTRDGAHPWLSADLTGEHANAQKLCRDGVGAACTKLGKAYLSGKGLTLDRPRAREILAIGCDRSDSEACRLSGLAYLEGVDSFPRNPQLGATFLDSACTLNDTASCNYLAQALLGDNALTKDPKRAKAVLDRSCDKLDYEACTLLGTIYLTGEDGIPKDPDRALDLFKRSCSARLPRGCRYLGELLSKGEPPVRKDEDGANRAFSEACRLGDRAACR